MIDCVVPGLRSLRFMSLLHEMDLKGREAQRTPLWPKSSDTKFTIMATLMSLSQTLLRIQLKKIYIFLNVIVSQVYIILLRRVGALHHDVRDSNHFVVLWFVCVLYVCFIKQ